MKNVIWVLMGVGAVGLYLLTRKGGVLAGLGQDGDDDGGDSSASAEGVTVPAEPFSYVNPFEPVEPTFDVLSAPLDLTQYLSPPLQPDMGPSVFTGAPAQPSAAATAPTVESLAAMQAAYAPVFKAADVRNWLDRINTTNITADMDSSDMDSAQQKAFSDIIGRVNDILYKRGIMSEIEQDAPMDIDFENQMNAILAQMSAPNTKDGAYYLAGLQLVNAVRDAGIQLEKSARALSFASKGTKGLRGLHTGALHRRGASGSSQGGRHLAFPFQGEGIGLKTEACQGGGSGPQACARQKAARLGWFWSSCRIVGEKGKIVIHFV